MLSLFSLLLLPLIIMFCEGRRRSLLLRRLLLQRKKNICRETVATAVASVGEELWQAPVEILVCVKI